MRPTVSRFGAALVLAAAFALTGCGSLPPLAGRTPSYALQDTADTPLGQAVAPRARQNPEKTGVIGFPDGRAALGLRVWLARNAAKSIDVQTFVWDATGTGALLYEEMLKAADRGVRVRLLVDDSNTQGLDSVDALLAAHPNIELRLYNPYVSRGSRMLGILGDFERLNHRMHNKSFTVDNQVTIVGGRNLADEYFEAGEALSFADLDVLSAGVVVPSVSNEFDLYWNSESAYPAKLILDPSAPVLTREMFKQRVNEWLGSPVGAGYVKAVEDLKLLQRVRDGELSFEWTTAQVVNDDPAKTLRPTSETDLQLVPRLAKVWNSATTQLDLISPYFVPGENGTELLVALVKRGVRVRVLTNSLAATDEASVHTGYARYRKRLLQGGVELFEFRPSSTTIREHAHQIGSSAQAGLHAKSFAVDRKTVFVGSFNLDPRSARLNTEMGLLIDSPSMAERLSRFLDGAAPGIAYQVRLDPEGHLQWLDG
ncbi:MAG TPA: phospholipase D family protein, partial [Ramlibacter sp.]|nr:phospholipase D family protein [Ramlibacter sp.]